MGLPVFRPRLKNTNFPQKVDFDLLVAAKLDDLFAGAGCLAPQIKKERPIISTYPILAIAKLLTMPRHTYYPDFAREVVPNETGVVALLRFHLFMKYILLLLRSFSIRLL